MFFVLNETSKPSKIELDFLLEFWGWNWVVAWAFGLFFFDTSNNQQTYTEHCRRNRYHIRLSSNWALRLYPITGPYIESLAPVTVHQISWPPIKTFLGIIIFIIKLRIAVIIIIFIIFLIHHNLS